MFPVDFSLKGFLGDVHCEFTFTAPVEGGRSGNFQEECGNDPDSGFWLLFQFIHIILSRRIGWVLDPTSGKTIVSMIPLPTIALHESYNNTHKNKNYDDTDEDINYNHINANLRKR